MKYNRMDTEGIIVKILIVNKFLHPNGGSETYIFKLGQYLQSIGHEVQYFGMEHGGRIVGNRAESYTSNMDFHKSDNTIHGKVNKLLYPVKTIYNIEARRKLRKVLNDFKPDVVHLNNFNYQLTPSVIVEIVCWRKNNRQDGVENSNLSDDGKCRIVYTAHDYQLVCPNHMCYNPNTQKNCEKCLGDGRSGRYGRGHFIHCIGGKCIHGSRAKSVVGALEAAFWQWRGIYKYIDKIICCSEFMKGKMDTNPLFVQKTLVLHNFVEDSDTGKRKKHEEAHDDKITKANDKMTAKNHRIVTNNDKPYILYFGRFSEEKGIDTLIEACKLLPEVKFVFAGTGPLEDKINAVDNIENVGFQTGEDLKKLICNARFSIYPSKWYENCPFSVMESQKAGIPVLGARIGGIPELIRDGETGRLFESGNCEDLCRVIREMWQDIDAIRRYSDNCHELNRDGLKEYGDKLLRIYQNQC